MEMTLLEYTVMGKTWIVFLAFRLSLSVSRERRNVHDHESKDASLVNKSACKYQKCSINLHLAVWPLSIGDFNQSVSFKIYEI